ncbi:MAG: hypothetical protein LPK03_00400, partial [Pontibacter sp.]|nr:hypothetical protein [Pontibacter sp.]
MKQIYLLLSCMLLLLCACEFEPSGSHFEEINPTPTNNINIDLNKAADTIYAKGPITYNLYLQLPGKQLRSYQVLMDGTVIKQGQNTSDVIYIDTKKYADGVHELKVLVESNTGTKSMADKAGYEYMQVYRTWTLILDNAPPTPVQITRLVAEDGTIKLAWDTYERRYIRNYIVS